MENEIYLIRYYWGLLLKHPLVWFVPMLVVGMIGVFVVLQAPRPYLSTARVAVQSAETRGSLVQSTVTDERVQFVEQRVFSRENLVALANKLDLFPQARSTATSAQVAELVRQRISFDARPTNPGDPSSNSAVLTIGFTADTPELAASGAGEIVQMLIQANRNARISEASALRTFLEQEVRTRSAQAEGLDAEWNAFVSTNEALLPSRLAIYTSETQELQQELQTIQTASATLAADTRVLETQLALASRPAAGEETQLATLRSELATKQTVYSGTHPEIVSLRSQITALESSLAQIDGAAEGDANPPPSPDTAESAMLRERISSAQQQQDNYAARRGEINERLEWLRGTIAKMPAVEGDMLALQRRHTGADANLADMQSRLDTALVGERLESAQQDSQISIIDRPDIPPYPTGNARTRGFAVTAALAAAAGLVCIVLLGFFDRTIKSKRDFTRTLEGAALVVIPDWKPDSRRGRHARLASMMPFLALGPLASASSVDLPQNVAVEPTQDASLQT